MVRLKEDGTVTLDITALAPVALAILGTAGLTVGLMQWLLKPQFDAVNQRVDAVSKRVDELKADIRELRAAVYVPRTPSPPPEVDRL